MKEFKEYKNEKDERERIIMESLISLMNSPVIHITDPSVKDTWVVREGEEPFEKIKSLMQKRIDESSEHETDIPLFSEIREAREGDDYIEYLTESENREVDRWVQICEEEFDGNPMDEGFLGKLVGGVAGFIIGPTIGKVIAKALGVNRGILYDMFTSRLVSAALGASIAKAFGGEYKN